MSYELTVTVVQHPAGCLVRIAHDGGSLTLDRDEALQLHELLRQKLVEMPVNIQPK